MEQLAIFSKENEVKLLLEELEDCSESSSRRSILLDKIATLIGAEFFGSDLIYKQTGKSVDMYKVQRDVGFLAKTSMKYRLNQKGVETIYQGKDAFLVYQGNKIPRPSISACESVVRRIFDLEI